MNGNVSSSLRSTENRGITDTEPSEAAKLVSYLTVKETVRACAVLQIGRKDSVNLDIYSSYRDVILEYLQERERSYYPYYGSRLGLVCRYMESTLETLDIRSAKYTDPFPRMMKKLYGKTIFTRIDKKALPVIWRGILEAGNAKRARFLGEMQLQAETKRCDQLLTRIEKNHDRMMIELLGRVIEDWEIERHPQYQKTWMLKGAFYAAIVNLKTKATDMLDYENLEKIAVELLRRTRRAIVRQQLIECLTAAVKEKINI